MVSCCLDRGNRYLIVVDKQVAFVCGALKEKLAAEHSNDRAAYTKGKTEFILNIYRTLGLTEEES